MYVSARILTGLFAVARFGIQRLRREESTFFQLRAPWASLSNSERDNLGIANILKAWGLPESSLITRSLLACNSGWAIKTQLTINVSSVFYKLLDFVVCYFLHLVYYLFM